MDTKYNKCFKDYFLIKFVIVKMYFNTVIQ